MGFEVGFGSDRGVDASAGQLLLQAATWVAQLAATQLSQPRAVSPAVKHSGVQLATAQASMAQSCQATDADIAAQQAQ